jgi:hypothetical protein
MRAFRALLCATLFTQACWSVYPGELHVLARVAPDVTVPPGASLSLVAGPQGQATIATVTSGNYSTFAQFQTTAPESYPATLRFLVDSPPPDDQGPLEVTAFLLPTQGASEVLASARTSTTYDGDEIELGDNCIADVDLTLRRGSNP